MNKRKRFLSGILVFAMVIMLIPLYGTRTVYAGGGIQAKLNSLQSQFPNGKFWNHLVTSGMPDGDTLMRTGNEVAMNSVTDHPCATHTSSARMGQYDCNYFDGGIQCFGFANRIFYGIFGIRASSCAKNYDKNIRVGDWVRVNSDSHSAVVTSINGNSFTVAECNLSLAGMQYACMIRWGRTYDKSAITYYKRASNWDVIENGNANSPQGYIDVAEGGNESVHVRGWAFDRDNSAASINVHVYIGGDAASGEGHSITADLKRDDVNAVFSIGGQHGYDATINTSKRGKQTVYIYEINIGGGNNVLIGQKDVYITEDKEAPVITDAKIVNETVGGGYTIQCKVTDNIGVDRVQCPTWTQKNDQDDLDKDWSTNEKYKATDKGNGIYEYTVNAYDHNWEAGLYNTHIYAYDKHGNYSSFGINGIGVYENRINYRFQSTGKNIRILFYKIKLREGEENSTLTATTTNKKGESYMQTFPIDTISNGNMSDFDDGYSCSIVMDRGRFTDSAEGLETLLELKNKDGKLLEEQTVTDNFDEYQGPYEVNVNVGDKIDLYTATGYQLKGTYSPEDSRKYTRAKYYDINGLSDSSCIKYDPDDTGNISVRGIVEGVREGTVLGSFVENLQGYRVSFKINVVDPTKVTTNDSAQSDNDSTASTVPSAPSVITPVPSTIDQGSVTTTVPAISDNTTVPTTTNNSANGDATPAIKPDEQNENDEEEEDGDEEEDEFVDSPTVLNIKSWRRYKKSKKVSISDLDGISTIKIKGRKTKTIKLNGKTKYTFKLSKYKKYVNRRTRWTTLEITDDYGNKTTVKIKIR